MSYDPYAAYGAAAPADPYAGGYAAYGAPPPAAFGGYPGAAAYGAPPPAAYGAPGMEEVRTIFITGFPADVKERELNNLLRFLPGYEASQMNWNKGLAQGFALFATGAHARAACDSLQHVQFDEVSSLRCEVARKNMYIKDDPNKRPRMAAPPAMGGYGYPPAAPVAAPAYRAPAGGYAPVSNSGDNPPCNTLFVGNLSDHVDENELRALFANMGGFRNFKLMRGARATSAFVEFEELNSAMAAHAAQQGAIISSNDRGGLRVQYSKNPFGKKRDINGQLIDTPVREGEVGGPPLAGPYGTNPMPGAAGPKLDDYQPTAF